MHLLTVVRSYLGMSQSMLANAAGITQPDLSEMETLPPYGKIYKYQRLSDYLGIPVDVIVKNECSRIPLSFFEKHTVPEYRPVTKSSEAELGRMGEEFILRREKKRLGEISPTLARLVVPSYKMPRPFPGYDIITFDEKGNPYFLEVKTSLQDSCTFRLTKHEMDTAKRLTKAGETYVVTVINSWGTDVQSVTDIPFTHIDNTHRVSVGQYVFTPLPETKTLPVTGLEYFRRQQGLTQRELCEALQIPPTCLCFYELSQRTPPITTYLKISELLDVPIDALMATYPALPDEARPYE